MFTNPIEFLKQELSKLPEATNLVIVFDPEFYNTKCDSFFDQSGREWKSFFYFGNDLELRIKLPQLKVVERLIFFVQPILLNSREKIKTIQVSYIPDILIQADQIFDLSIEGILKKVFPQESWPSTLHEYSRFFSNKLHLFFKHLKKLKKLYSGRLSLDSRYLKILSLTTLNDLITIEELTDPVLSEEEAIEKLLIFSLKYDLEESEISLLKSILMEQISINEDNFAWFEYQIQSISKVIYLYDALYRNLVHNPIIQIQGLGILEIDAIKLETLLPIITHKLKNSETIWERLITYAENKLSIIDIKKITKLYSFSGVIDYEETLRYEKGAAFAYSILLKLFLDILTQKNKSELFCQIHTDILDNLHNRIFDTRFSNQLRCIIKLLKNIVTVEKCIKESIPQFQDLTNLIIFYEKSNSFLLELELSESFDLLKNFEDNELESITKNYLGVIQDRVEKYLNEIDNKLSDIIISNWSEYINHPRLNINILREAIGTDSYRLPKKEKIWILIFDGMRRDTWEKTIKPILQEEFLIEDEKLYITVLPSYTDISRISLLAGKIPTYWKDYDNQPTTNHNYLFGKLLGISKKELKNKVRIVTGTETDYAQDRLDQTDAQFNVLIYLVSDNWIHQKNMGNLRALNDRIFDIFNKEVLPDIKKRIGQDDKIIVTSDHGFIELKKEKGIPIKINKIWDKFEDDEKNPVNYRYLKDIEFPKGVKISYDGKSYYTLAVGRFWFKREAGRFTRYVHGGISCDEMIVPTATLKKIKTPIILFDLDINPLKTFIEGEKINLEAIIRNTGNQAAISKLQIITNLGQKFETVKEMSPGISSTIKYNVIAELDLRSVSFELSYSTEKKSPKIITKELAIKVKPEEGKIKVDTSALDRFDLE